MYIDNVYASIPFIFLFNITLLFYIALLAAIIANGLHAIKDDISILPLTYLKEMP